MAKLRGSLKVRLTEDSMGSITIAPVSDAIHDALMAEFGQYLPKGHKFTVFIQEAHADQYRGDLPKSAFYRGDWNDGAVFIMDVWTFRHMVGYQVG